MKKVLFCICLIALLSSCRKEYKNDDKIIKELGFFSNFDLLRESKRYKLRQLSSGDEQYTKTSASFFLIAGSFSKEYGKKYEIKVFCETGSGYKVFSLDPNYTYINIDNELNTPELSIYYVTRLNGEYKGLDYYMQRGYQKVLIYTPEKYFPESIESFDINQ